MSRHRPAASCREISFTLPCALEPASQVALEDYARVLTGAANADVVEQAPREVSGVHLCGLSAAITPIAERDITDFARELAAALPGGGLGWS
jgi:hypothetical protein